MTAAEPLIQVELPVPVEEFRSDHQLAVTVDQWNDGLLLVTWPRDSASVTLSVFGLDDAAVVDLSERWNAWWVDHVGPPDPDSPYA